MSSQSKFMINNSQMCFNNEQENVRRVQTFAKAVFFVYSIALYLIMIIWITAKIHSIDLYAMNCFP